MRIIEILKRIWTRLVFGKAVPKTEPHPSTQAEVDKAVAEGTSDLVSDAALAPKTVDEFLLDQSRTQWQFGDWESLATLSHERILGHPDRAKLALLGASGLQQLGRLDEAKVMIRQALDWGCSPQLVRQILISGVHNSLARAHAFLGEEQEANKHFAAAIDAGAPYSDRLVKVARLKHQMELVAKAEQ